MYGTVLTKSVQIRPSYAKVMTPESKLSSQEKMKVIRKSKYVTKYKTLHIFFSLSFFKGHRLSKTTVTLYFGGYNIDKLYIYTHINVCN